VIKQLVSCSKKKILCGFFFFFFGNIIIIFCLLVFKATWVRGLQLFLSRKGRRSNAIFGGLKKSNWQLQREALCSAAVIYD